MHKILKNLAAKHIPNNIDYWSLRSVKAESEGLSVRKNIVEPVSRSYDQGYMVMIHDKGGLGYASSADFSEVGIKSAIQKAINWAELSAQKSVCDFSTIQMPSESGTYKAQELKSWESLSLPDRLNKLQKACEKLKDFDNKENPKIVEWSSSAFFDKEVHEFSASNGAEFTQEFSIISPDVSVTAADKNNIQTRTLVGFRGCHQGGWEVADDFDFDDAPEKVTGQALELLAAPNCPSGNMSLLLMPDQMMLQIHESIGHPVELDRILGDERNYAGTTFVTSDMFGSYQYGSDLLNITFDPNIKTESASYAFDDEGLPAKKEFIIKNGLLEKPLGGVISQARANLPGVANSRASSWNRPPLDRMANLNLEPGSESMDDLVANIEHGVLMASNKSWSIDDSRNKFQFGCEWGQLIENGEIKHVVKNPNYRGISATFWRNLSAVGDKNTFGVFGTPYCGKAEPNQCIRVGHASPACVFSNVDVFGGEE